MNKYITLLIVIIFSGCINHNNNKNKREEIFNDIFVDLVDSTATDFRRIIGPFPKDLANEKNKKQFYKKIDSLKKINLPPLKVIINNTTYKLNLNGVKYRLKKYLNGIDIDEILNFKNSSVANELNLNLNNFSNEKYTFIYKHDLDSSVKQSRLGKYSFSELHFNKDNDICVFSYGLYYSSLNGSNFLCVLKKEKGVWQIFKIIEVGIS